MLVLLANNFTNYTAVDYARKEERVIRPSRVRRPRSVGRFPAPESSCNVDDGRAADGEVSGFLNGQIWPRGTKRNKERLRIHQICTGNLITIESSV